MRIAFIYGGQGSQIEGMGLDLVEHSLTFEEILKSVDPDEVYHKIMFFNELPKDHPDTDVVIPAPSEDILSRTEYAQPCMVAFAMALTAMLFEKGIFPEMTAGLSLGEYSALACSEVISPWAAVELVAYRGKVMAEGVEGIDSGMTAVLGLAEDKLLEACEKASHLGVAEIANYNCPGQLVMTGERVALEEASKIAKELGAKRCLPLKVSGPFHSSLMAGAGEKLRTRLQQYSFDEMQIPVVFNCIGREKQEEETLENLLVKQIQSPVYFQKSIEYMIEQGIDTFVEIGPGKVLSGFVKKINRDVKIYSVSDVASVEAVVEALGQQE